MHTTMTSILILLLLLQLALAFRWVLVASRETAISNIDPDEDPHFAWRHINLAIGDGYRHPDANKDLASLRAAGWHIEKAGNERAGFVYLKLLPPGHKD